jgi:hypothetical protein
MTTTNENCSFNIELYECKTEECLKFTFEGKFCEENALIGAEEWKNIFSSIGNEKSMLIWDCTKMTGYESKALSIWQNTMKELKSKIGVVWLISDSVLIRTGAKLISAFTGFKIKAVKYENEIKF